MNVFGFMYSILQHLPPKQFRLVRYYGAYSRRKKKVVKDFIKQSIIMQPKLEFNGIVCSDCGEVMEVIGYCRKPPPEDRSRINAWID